MTRNRFLGILSTIALIGSFAPAARAQALLSFTGGSGAPLTLALLSPVTYTVTANSNGIGPGFIFQNVGDLLGNSNPQITSTITYSVNGGALKTLSNAVTSYVGGDVSATDMLVFSDFADFSTLFAGDTVTLQSGTLTTTGNVAVAAPADGSYDTFLIDGTDAKISGPGSSAAPEPGSVALLSLVALPAIGLIRRRK